MDNIPTTQHLAKPAANPWRTFGIIVITIVVTLGIAYWVVTAYLFPSAFTPVTLSHSEQQRLNHKLEHLGITPPGEPALTPEPYRETDASRDITFTEKELNALLANNTDLASKLAIDLSDDLASAKLLVHLDPDMPFFGGKTLKVTAGLELKIKDGHPHAVLKGVSVWGVPLPNAWLGNMKNIDLIQEFGDAGGFWQAIKDGVQELEIKDGKLHVILKK
jgi:hypothetical protein